MKVFWDKYFFVEDMVFNNWKLKVCYVRENCYFEWDVLGWFRFYVFFGN